MHMRTTTLLLATFLPSTPTLSLPFPIFYRKRVINYIELIKGVISIHYIKISMRKIPI